MAQASIGIWLIGARGGVAATTILGLCALRRGLAGASGLVSELPQFRRLPLAGWDDFTVAGHEIRDVALVDEAMRLADESRAIDRRLIEACRGELEQIDRRIRPGTVCKVGRRIEELSGGEVPRGESPREAVDRVREDLARFVKAENLQHVIVVNVASTEPPVDPAAVPPRWAQLEPLLDRCSYLNFTPSLGSSSAAVDELARLRNTRHMGCDGKTGETLVKSTLAPMFRQRNLRVMSWVGHNIFGNMDGKILDDPANKRAKVASKDHLLGKILGQATGKPPGTTSISRVFWARR